MSTHRDALSWHRRSASFQSSRLLSGRLLTAVTNAYAYASPLNASDEPRQVLVQAHQRMKADHEWKELEEKLAGAHAVWQVNTCCFDRCLPL